MSLFPVAFDDFDFDSVAFDFDGFAFAFERASRIAFSPAAALQRPTLKRPAGSKDRS